MVYDMSTGAVYDEGYYGGYDDMSVAEATTEVSVDGLLSNWFFVGGVSAGTLLISIVIGLLLAKAKIKKGFDVYED